MATTTTVAECQATSGTDSSSIIDAEERKAEALESLMDGKRHLLCKDFPAAVSCLTEACEELSAVCGEKAPECGEAYYYYGKALLEMARLENVVLGNALVGVPEGEDVDTSPEVEDPDKVTDEERADVEDKVDEALEENFDSCANAEMPLLATEAVDVPMDAEGSENTDMDVDDAEEEGEESPEDNPDEKEAAAEQAKAAEEPSTLQLAWEVLELSKIICKEQMEKGKTNAANDTVAAMEKRFWDIHHLLAEVSVESGNYGQAVEDLKTCLESQKVLLPADSRNIAVTHYQLGVAYGFEKKYEEAIVSLEAADKALKNTMANLKTTSGNMARMEVTEIEALLPEIKAKIADINDLKAGKMDVSEMKGGISLEKDVAVNSIPTKNAVA